MEGHRLPGDSTARHARHGTRPSSNAVSTMSKTERGSNCAISSPPNLNSRNSGRTTASLYTKLADGLGIELQHAARTYTWLANLNTMFWAPFLRSSAPPTSAAPRTKLLTLHRHHPMCSLCMAHSASSSPKSWHHTNIDRDLRRVSYKVNHNIMANSDEQ